MVLNAYADYCKSKSMAIERCIAKFGDHVCGPNSKCEDWIEEHLNIIHDEMGYHSFDVDGNDYYKLRDFMREFGITDDVYYYEINEENGFGVLFLAPVEKVKSYLTDIALMVA